MNQFNKRILTIGFFILIWIGIMVYAYQKNKYQNIQLKEQEKIKINNNQVIQKRIHNPETDNDIFNHINNNKKLQNYDLNNKNFFDEQISEKCGDFPCYTAQQFLDIYNDFEKELGLNYSDKNIYNAAADAYLRHIAERKGYKNRVFAHASDIIDYNQLQTRKSVRDSYIAMRDEMKKENIILHFVSGYRSADKQVSIFKRKMGQIDVSKISHGLYDEKITTVLNRSALPGYSKHHSGYAVDFGCGSDYLVYEFATTKCYEWMSKNNFENVKHFGFIPSYPNAIIRQGPDPEPWEYVWVGRGYIENYFNDLF